MFRDLAYHAFTLVIHPLAMNIYAALVTLTRMIYGTFFIDEFTHIEMFNQDESVLITLCGQKIDGRNIRLNYYEISKTNPKVLGMTNCKVCRTVYKGLIWEHIMIMKFNKEITDKLNKKLQK